MEEWTEAWYDHVLNEIQSVLIPYLSIESNEMATSAKYSLLSSGKTQTP